MASITVRNIDEQTKALLRIRAAHHGRSMEEEARNILRSALSSPGHMTQDLATAIRRRFRAAGGIDLELPPREPVREPPGFDE